MNKRQMNYDVDREITSKRLRDALHNANMKPSELSERSGVSKSSISQYCNGVICPSNISAQRMGKVLGVHPLWLMGFSDEYLPEASSSEPSAPSSLFMETHQLDSSTINRLSAYAYLFTNMRYLSLLNELKDADLDDVDLITEMLKKLNKKKQIPDLRKESEENNENS